MYSSLINNLSPSVRESMKVISCKDVSRVFVESLLHIMTTLRECKRGNLKHSRNIMESSKAIKMLHLSIPKRNVDSTMKLLFLILKLFLNVVRENVHVPNVLAADSHKTIWKSLQLFSNPVDGLLVKMTIERLFCLYVINVIQISIPCHSDGR